AGTDLASAYQASLGPPAPSYGGQTIATLQLSGWDDANLYTWAQAEFGANTPNPTTDGQYTQIAVDGASPSTPDNMGDDAEVALDQETLLGTAPYADQRAYFTPNTDQGEIDALNQIAKDAAAPGAHIVALSISYGDCESAYVPATVQALEGIFQQLLAEGVTIFAPSGDTGSADCTGSTANAVDYPGSSPSVVDVGGTTLSLGPPVSETAWSGSGGGVSSLFPRPSWQSSLSAIPGNTRVVPDIASDADPNTGYGVYCTTIGCQAGSTNGWSVIGGTSLAAPTAAGLFTSELIDGGLTHGVGDIHQVLYSAPSADFRDITSGSNGSYSAGPGYDEVTGIGAPLWDLLRPLLITQATTYHPVSPVRVLDMRTGVGGTSNPLGPKQTYVLNLAGASGSPVPAGATGVVLNVTATQGTSTTYVSVYPTGDPAGPGSSNLNVTAGQTVPNLVSTRLAPDGSVTFYNNLGTVYVLADLEGYETADTTGATYHPVSPVRVLDTRDGLGAPQAPLGPQGTLNLALAGATGSPVPANATAVALNLTATDTTADTYVSAYPTGESSGPQTSSLNLLAGQTDPNLAIVTLSTQGSITIYNNRGSTDVIADVEGYYTPDTSGVFYHPLDPHRLLDTRSGLGAPQAPVGPHGTISVTVAGVQGTGVPPGVTAVALNITGTNPTSITYLSVYPTGDTNGPHTSNLNLVPGQTAPNLVVVPVASDNTVTIYNNLGSTDVVADVEGYYSTP
ncbi:MAG: S53 family peptidase, partial [Mycobacteriales bacterium]